MALLALARSRETELTGTAAIATVAAMIGVLFAGSTLLTPLYVIYKEQWGFSRITLTLIYAAYVVGNLAALLVPSPLWAFFVRRGYSASRRD